MESEDEIEKLTARYEGELHIWDKILPCAVLSDNTRVLTAASVFEAFDRPRKGKSSEGYRADLMPSFINANNLQPFVDEQFRAWTELIPYTALNGVQRQGYDARILRGLCKIYIDARKAGALLKSQERFADISETILYALSDVGIVALVDEATGYQYDREKDELQKILKAYISEELLPWQKRFPDIFYKELFRLNGWNFTIRDIRKRPGIIGTWTKAIIYKELPKGVLEELKNKTPKNEDGKLKAKLHQSLTLDVGEPNLERQITKVVALFQVSDNMEQFWRNFQKMKDRQSGQLEIPFDFDEDGHTKE